MVLYFWDLLFGLYPSSLCFLNHNVPPIEASSIDRSQQGRFHLRTREEPSLETLWLKKHKDGGQVQITDPSFAISAFIQLLLSCCEQYVRISLPEECRPMAFEAVCL
jgi:hypothetical protein